ncbi:hypothetical protein HX807_06005 [Pseudomonas sp. D8002]|uniref:hypothetical protein n=1 Tax=Pseudomonas sp. D8002 TaxID=2738816 RepID=UPI0015A40F81|nr:hypothetical protein [Pseudomonas sp. D8002]NWA88149.1 hypothetical protein [Pseudomonas sp. D8002]
MSNCLVSLSEQAFFTIATSALEAYRVDHSADLDGTGIKLETFGYLWGHLSSTSMNETVYRISQANVSTAAHRTGDSVTARDDAYTLKNTFVESFFPELRFLGDFHSHPYSQERDAVRTELDLERNEFYRFSTADMRSAKAQQDACKDYRVGLVITVFEREEQVARSNMYLDDQSCIRFQYDSMTIWIKAYVWAGDDYRRKADKMVTLICPPAGFSLQV